MQDSAPRHRDGRAGDANYGAIGQGYANHRRPDPRIAELILTALGDARTILNVGNGRLSSARSSWSSIMTDPVKRCATAKMR